MTELPIKYPIEENDDEQKFTFEKCAQRDITNQQLHLWSASIDFNDQEPSFASQLSVNTLSKTNYLIVHPRKKLYTIIIDTICTNQLY